jgi:hypothetical protein
MILLTSSFSIGKILDHKMAKNYLYINAPDILPDEYDIIRKKYLDLEENYLNR